MASTLAMKSESSLVPPLSVFYSLVDLKVMLLYGDIEDLIDHFVKFTCCKDQRCLVSNQLLLEICKLFFLTGVWPAIVAVVADSGSGDTHKITQVSDLDFGDPLYLHASDTSTTALVSLKLKGTENYNVWSRAMTLALHTKNMYGFVDGSCKKSKTDIVLMLQWDRCNSVVLSWILNSISDELYCGQVFAQSAQTVWEELKETYDKIDGSFDALVKLPTCVCEANKEFKTHNDLIKLMQFLMGLDESYSSMRSNILLIDPLPSVKTAFAIVSRDESHRTSSQASSSGSVKNQNSAFLVSKTFDNKRRIGNGPNPNLKCTKCKRLGHTIERCYEIVGYPPGWVKRNDNKSVVSNNSVPAVNTSDNSSHPFSSEQISLLMSLLHDQSTQGNVHANMAGTFFNFNIVFTSKFDTFFKQNGSSNNDFNNKWIIDSGATRHMTGSSEGLVNVFDVSKLNMTVGHSNGKLQRLDLDLKKVVGIGNEVGGLYIFDCDKGHPATQVLKLLKNSIGINPNSDNDVCDVCHKAKQSRDPFPLSDHTSSKIGKLVHLDIWGPYRVNSYSGFKFFLTIVDDFSRAIWVYLLKTKSDVFDNLLSFVKLIKNQFM
ncbi:uncharacterized protein [Rutidosis leptorrhynchoides]|uniref:uncharacterized protein n=1 Tax=Rutidosis leptorrhynchoides TaxID=125765 RepID=UPI003A98E255